MAAFVPQELRVYRFHPAGLDPIAVYVEQYGPTASRMTVQCYEQAWTTYWGAHGDDGLESFVMDCNDTYVVDNLRWGTDRDKLLKQYRNHDRDYLVEIVKAIKSEFAARAAGGEA